MHDRQLQIIETLQHPRGLLHPARQRLPIDLDALARENARLAIERRLPGVFRHGDMADQRRRDHPALDQPRRGLGLNNRPFTGAAGIFRADRAQHTQHRRNSVQDFGDLFADPMHFPGATRTNRCLWFDHLLAAGQMFRQGSDVALGRATRLPRRRLLVVVGGGARRRGASFIRQIERELLRANCRQPLRPRPEDQPLQCRDRRSQRLVLRVEGERQFAQQNRITREIFGTKRHVEKLPRITSNRQQN